MKKILIIEDNNDIRENTAEILELEGYQTVTAANGISGVEKAFSEKPDLIFCDILMPDLDGYALLYLLGKNNDTMNIPFIFLTALSEKSGIQKGLGLGATNFVIKPFTDAELLDAAKAGFMKQSFVKPLNPCSYPELSNFLEHARKIIKLPILDGGVITRPYSKQESIFSEHTKPVFVYYVISGKIKSYLYNESGKEFVTNLHGPGEFMGYMAVLEDTHHKDNAVADEDSLLLLIPCEDFLQLIHHDPSLAKQFLRLLAGDNLLKEERLISLVYYSFRKRVISSLLSKAEDMKPNREECEISDIFENRNLTAYGSPNEYLLAILNDLKEEKLIDIHEKKIVIRKEKRLKEYLDVFT